MRSALRTSIVTAALAGALLAPAATTAFAAPSVQSATASGYGTVSDDDRYAGEPVYIGEGLVAVLRNGPEGPEAWIRAVGEQWKPGDTYMVRVLTLLDRSHSGDTVHGLSLKLTRLNTSAPVLTVTKEGATKSFALPKASSPKTPDVRVEPAPEGPKTPAAAKTPVTADEGRYDGEVVLVGKGRIAVLRNAAEGPEVWIRAVSDDWKPGDGWAGRVLAALDPSGPRAVVDGTAYELAKADNGRYGLTVRPQGGGAPALYLLPEAEPAAAKPAAQPAAKPAAVVQSAVSVQPAADVKPQGGAQTVVVPRGGVDAGAEFAAEDTGNGTTAAAGAGLVAIFAGVGVALMARARRATRGRG
ncbi:hypothetical protein OV450_6539 [Actinobacteria bacterium OV450]|nr:hypothetical protein OV450_6539 [Actinobacteria bacterium OV450]